MAYKLFAAIHVGSEEVKMKIYELSKNDKLREIEQMSYFIELGSDTYSTGEISHEAVRELCDVLSGFKLKMKEYKITDYVALASSALREAANADLIIDQIRIKTGLHVQTIGNAKQSMLVLRSIALNMDNFRKIISEGAAIVNMGAGSLQIMVYQNSHLTFTQNLKLGSLRIREILADVEGYSENFVNVMDDYIGNDVDTFGRLYMKDQKVRHLVIAGNEMSAFIKMSGTGKNMIKRGVFDELKKMVLNMEPEAISEQYSIPYELATLLQPASIVYDKIIRITGADRIWPAGSDLCDGMVMEQTISSSRIREIHDFDEDIIYYSRLVAKRFNSNISHTSNVEKLALKIFDGMKKETGMSERDRLLLRSACILHDCGKFLNMRNSTAYSCEIIMATEFIGLSRRDRSIIGQAVYCNSLNQVPKQQTLRYHLSNEDYICMLKICAILRIANQMDRSHKQKIENITVTLKNKELVIRADSLYDITLEQSTIEARSYFFAQIFGYKPVLKMKRR